MKLRVIILFFIICIIAEISQAKSVETTSTSIRILVTQPAVKFIPSIALGAALDGLQKGDVNRIYAPASIKEMSTIPFYRVSYRLRTELGAEVWHWNPKGSWSDSAHHQGYWVSSDKAEKSILVSNGYHLPRRGNTFDQANQDGYSRLSDGDTKSFWKSNPYLDKYFTGEDNTTNPQWVLINFEKAVNIQGMRILWGDPFATEYEVQYWDGASAKYYNGLYSGRWRSFPKGVIKTVTGGSAFLHLSNSPIRTHYIRIVLKTSSGTYPAGSTDIRDRLGFAIRELYAGDFDSKSKFRDRMVHEANGKTQTKILTSSTDPWHRAVDLDKNIEQPGIDLVMQSTLTRQRSVMIPTGLLYDTPDNTAAEIRFLKNRGYNIQQIELGEEPDGQYVFPEHYGALFIQFAKAIKQENASLVVGGPGFQSEVDGWKSMPNNDGQTSWMKRFLSYLKDRNHLGDFGFFSFEWYPFDDCDKNPSEQLIEHPVLINKTMEYLAKDGVPKNIPWIITEYGYSSFAAQREVELPAALLNAEIVAQYLLKGISTVYLYGIEPNVPIKEKNKCDWGNLMALEERPNGKANWRLPTYYGMKLISEEWLGAPNEVHALYPTRLLGPNASDPSIAAYAVYRPEKKWAMLILNKDPHFERVVNISFDKNHLWSGPVNVIQYSRSQYKWKANGEKGYPRVSNPPIKTKIFNKEPLSLRIPPMSISVVRAM